MTLFKLTALCVLALGTAAAVAAVEVRFITPEKFTDMRDAGSSREELLKDLQAHVQQLGDKHLPGKDLLIEVIDIDRAGAIEPASRLMNDIRIMRSVTRPGISLRYVVSVGARELRRGEAQISDLAYLERSNRYPAGDSLRYEKRMLDDWFKKEFKTQ